MSEFKSYSMSFYRQINLLSAEETKKYYDLVINSKRWLFYETRDNNCSNENLHKNSFGDRNLESKLEKDGFFLILNLEEEFIKQKLEKGFNSLIDSFDDMKQNRSTVEFIVI